MAAIHIPVYFSMVPKRIVYFDHTLQSGDLFLASGSEPVVNVYVLLRRTHAYIWLVIARQEKINTLLGLNG